MVCLEGVVIRKIIPVKIQNGRHNGQNIQISYLACFIGTNIAKLGIKIRILAIKGIQLTLNDTQTHIFHKNINPDTKQIGTGHFCKLGLFIFEN